MTTTVMAFWRDRAGATSIEYGLIALFIAVGIIGVLQLIAPQLISIFDRARDGMVSV